MARITVGDVWTRIKQRADIEKSGASGFVSDNEGIKLIQVGTSQLQNLVMNTYEDWISRYATFTTVLNQLTYPVSSIGIADFYKLKSIGIITNVSSPQDSWMPLEHYDDMSMNLPAGGFFQFTSGFFTDMRYGLRADVGGPTIELRPVKAVTTLGVYYIPVPPTFETLDDELPYWIMPGWEEYMVAFGAWMVGVKERTSVEAHKEVWDMITRQIMNFAPNRDSFQPHTVIRASSYSYGAGYRGGWGGYGGY